MSFTAAPAVTYRRFLAPWRADKIVRDDNGQALAHIYSRDNEAEALQAKVLTKDEARRIAVNPPPRRANDKIIE
jgi:hypothetical protein